ncbi:MAG: GtrA family protein [Christensenellaceae bacterium]|nr:GtrA family protein [Christensenellaceae bacterium]
MNKILEKIKNIISDKKALNEAIRYIVIGVLTTLINLIVFWFFRNVIVINLFLASTIAWILAVLFAYFTNKSFVFNSKISGTKEILKTMAMFFAARILSFLIFDLFGLWLFVDIFKMYEFLAKILNNVFVIIFNFIASKWFIFKK